MSKRDYLKEISEIRNRSRIFNLESNFKTILRLHEITGTFESLEETDKELLKYVPISLVGCLEVFYRNLTKEIIDYGSPYIDNAKNLDNTNFKIVKAIQGEYLTIGDFLSHLLSFNNIKDIEKNISTLLDEGFIKQLKNVKAYYPWKTKGLMKNL